MLLATFVARKLAVELRSSVQLLGFGLQSLFSNTEKVILRYPLMCGLRQLHKCILKVDSAMTGLFQSINFCFIYFRTGTLRAYRCVYLLDLCLHSYQISLLER